MRSLGDHIYFSNRLDASGCLVFKVNSRPIHIFDRYIDVCVCVDLFNIN